MALLPKSRTARRRLTLVAAIAPVLALAVGLALYGLRTSISYFYTPAQARAAHVSAGRPIQLGGLVAMGSVAKSPDGATRFIVSDHTDSDTVVYRVATPLAGPFPGETRNAWSPWGAFDKAGRVRRHHHPRSSMTSATCRRSWPGRSRRSGEWRRVEGGGSPSTETCERPPHDRRDRRLRAHPRLLPVAGPGGAFVRRAGAARRRVDGGRRGARRWARSPWWRPRSAALIWAFVTSDFSVMNVAENSHTTKPLIYKIRRAPRAVTRARSSFGASC